MAERTFDIKPKPKPVRPVSRSKSRGKTRPASSQLKWKGLSPAPQNRIKKKNDSVQLQNKESFSNNTLDLHGSSEQYFT